MDPLKKPAQASATREMQTHRKMAQFKLRRDRKAGAALCSPGAHATTEARLQGISTNYKEAHSETSDVGERETPGRARNAKVTTPPRPELSPSVAMSGPSQVLAGDKRDSLRNFW